MLTKTATLLHHQQEQNANCNINRQVTSISSVTVTTTSKYHEKRYSPTKLCDGAKMAIFASCILSELRAAHFRRAF